MGLGIGLYFFMSFEGSSYRFVYPNRGRIFLRKNSNGLKVMGGYSGSRNSQLKNRPLKVDFRKASTKCSKFCNKYSYRPHFVVEATQKSCDLCSVYVFVRYLTVHIVSIDCTFIFINTNRIKISTFLFNFINNLLMQKRHTKQTDPNMFLK